MVESVSAAVLKRDVNLSPYVPYLARTFSRGVSHSRIAMRRGGEGMACCARGF